MLMVKAFRPRRPVRVFFLYWIFWFHALFVRLLAWFLLLLVALHKIAPDLDNATGTTDLSTVRNMFWPAGL